METVKASERLSAALTLLDGGRCWIKDTFESCNDGTWSYCPYGALMNVSFDPSVVVAKKFILRVVEGHFETLTEWNDSAPDFSVIEAGFRAAIELAESEGQ